MLVVGVDPFFPLIAHSLLGVKTEPYYVAQAGLKLTTLLPPKPRGFSYHTRARVRVFNGAFTEVGGCVCEAMGGACVKCCGKHVLASITCVAAIFVCQCVFTQLWILGHQRNSNLILFIPTQQSRQCLKDVPSLRTLHPQLVVLHLLFEDPLRSHMKTVSSY